MLLKNDVVTAVPALKKAPDDESYWSSVRALMKPMYTHTQLVNTRRGAAPVQVRDQVRSLVDLSLSYELDVHEPFRELQPGRRRCLLPSPHILDLTFPFLRTACGERCCQVAGD